MLCRYYLKIGVSEIGDNLDGCLDCTEMICNSDDIEVSYKRTSPFGGVVRKCTSSIVFCNEAKDLIYQEYLNNYLNAKAAFALYTINNDWTYSKEYECPLDFSSLQYEGNTIEMNTIDQSVAAIIKANKSVKYEFPVSDIKDEKQLYYDRLELSNIAKFCFLSDLSDFKDTKSYDINIDLGYTKAFIENGNLPSCYRAISLPLIIESSEVNLDVIELYSQLLSGHDENVYAGDWYIYSSLNKYGEGTVNSSIEKIAKSKRKIDINFIIDIDCSITRTYADGVTNEEDSSFQMKDYVILNIVSGIIEDNIQLKNRYYELIDLRNSSVAYKSIKKRLEFGLEENEVISLLITIPYLQSTKQITNNRSESIKFEANVRSLEISYKTRGESQFIDVINPKVLLDSILSKFNIKGRIDTEGYSKLISKTLIVAAESIRNIAEAKIYTSFSDFAKWMEVVFGFIYEIEAGEIVFKHRNRLFSENIVMDISGHVGELSVNLDNSNIYSIVRVGYNKQDYESINGRDEFRFANEYITGVEINENKLELISPYRADAYGFEFLCQKRGDSTTDNRSDKDIFFIDVTEDTTSYQLDRSILISGVINPASMFNQAFAPSEIVRSNDSYIGVFSNKLMFSSSEGNSDVSVNGVFESSDIELNQSLATVGKLKISSDIQKLPEGSFIGLFTFVLNGYRYTFYLDSVDFRYQREQQSTIEGIIKSIEKL